MSSVQITQGLPGDARSPNLSPFSATEPRSIAKTDDDKPLAKKYLLTTRHLREEHSFNGQLVSIEDHDGTIKVDGDTEVPILEAITVTFEGVARPEFGALKINSPFLLNALRCVSTENVEEPSFRVGAPYRLLHHLRDDLEAFKTDHPKTHNEEYVTECNSHIDYLLEFLKHDDGGRWRESERNRWKKDNPTVTWKNLWLLLRPGDVMLVKHEDQRTPYVLQWINGGPSKGKAEEYRLGLWNIDYDGEYFGRSLFTTEIKPFDGEIPMQSLKVFPASYEPDWPKLERVYIDRGKKFVETVSDYSYREYTGKTAEGIRREYKGERIVVDYTMNPWNFDDFKDCRKPRLGELFGEDSGGKICLCEFCTEASETDTKTVRPLYADLDLISKKDILTWSGEREKLYGLCTSILYGYVLRERLHRIFDIDFSYMPKFNTEIMDTLVMDDGKKEIIKGICNEFTKDESESDAFKADYVRGKGSGRIFLLHGVPGVGKTLTAECVAENTKRPLLSITAGDLGITAERVESMLDSFFRLAQDWKAILLLDEADVFLETREKRDLARNSVVSVFLRALEYYTGILFITTNRTGLIDEAFKSRIHVSIYYGIFTDAQRKQVWRNNFNKLQKDKKDDITVDEGARDFVLSDPEVKALRWNGREIRNCMSHSRGALIWPSSMLAITFELC